MGIDDDRYTTWTRNAASTFVVSSFAIISDILDDPKTFGLSNCILTWLVEEELSSENDNGDAESGDSDDDGQKAMWVDDIHLSTAGHQALANKLWMIFQV